MTDIMGLKKQSEEAEIVIIDGKHFVTNGVWEYGAHEDPTRTRYLPVGQIGWRVTCEPITLWERAALKAGEKEILRDIPRIIGGGDMINLGDLKGGSAILLAQGLEHNQLDGHVFTVDAYVDMSNKDEIRKIAVQNREESKVGHRITMIESKTNDALPQFKGKYSFLFIDADHSYEGVRDDWINYSPLAEWVAFHDTNQEPANRVIQEYVVKDWKLEYWVNRIKVFRRR